MRHYCARAPFRFGLHCARVRVIHFPAGRHAARVVLAYARVPARTAPAPMARSHPALYGRGVARLGAYWRQRPDGRDARPSGGAPSLRSGARYGRDIAGLPPIAGSAVRLPWPSAMVGNPPSISIYMLNKVKCVKKHIPHISPLCQRLVS
jgi:hypothetical protein